MNKSIINNSQKSSKSSSFVGRNGQLTKLLTHGHNALKKNQGKVVFLVGEAGIGKTALGQRFCKQMRDVYPDILYAYAYCGEKTGNISPYTPFIQLHQNLLDQVVLEDSKETTRENWLLEYVQEIGPDFFDIVPVAGTALKFAFKTAAFALKKQYDKRNSSEPKEKSIHLDQTNIFHLFTNSFRYIAHRKPLLLFVDDWHWADESSTNLLFYLSRQLADIPILLLAAYRPHESQARNHPILDIQAEMQRYDLCVNVSLDFLTSEEIAEYLLKRFQSTHFDSAFIDWLHKITSGNALFLKEYVELLLQDQALTTEGELVTDWQQIQPPNSVEAVISSRVRYLDTELRQILTYASVEGESFSTLLLEKVLEIKRLPLLKRLRIIENTHQLISELGQQTIQQQQITVYRFVHALVHRTLYNELSTGERVELSQILLELQGEIVEQMDEANRRQMLPQLINLADMAADYKAKASYALQAANEAEKTHAHAEVLKHCELGLEALDNLQSTSETEDIRMALLFKQGFTNWWFVGKWEKALEAYHRAKIIAEKQNNWRHLKSAYEYIGEVHRWRDECNQALEWYRQAINISEKHDEKPELVKAYSQIADAYSDCDKSKRARDSLNKALAISKELDNKNLSAQVYLDFAMVYSEEKKCDKAVTWLQKTIAIVNKLEEEEQTSFYNNIGFVYRACKKHQEALVWLKKIAAINEEQGDKLSLAVNYHNIAGIYRELGDYDQAFKLFQKVATIREKASDLRNLAITWYAMGSIALAQDELSKALALFTRSRELFIQIDLPTNVEWTEESIKEVQAKIAEV